MNLADERYVSLSTTRGNGEQVATPVWIAPLGPGRAGFTTAADSGKVKRIRHDASVTVVPCDMRGNVAAGAASLVASAEIVIGGATYDEVQSAISAKYGLMARLLRVGSRLKKLVGRGEEPNCAVVLRFG